MSNLGFAILAALCGLAVVQGDPTLRVNFDKFVVKNTDNPYTGEWTATLTPAKPLNKLSMETPVKVDVPEDLMVKLDLKSNGKPLPPVDVKVCKALLDEIIGKRFVEFGSPFPKACQIKKGDYKVVDYVVKTDKVPPGIPDGKLVGVAEIYMPGKKPIMTFELEGEISHAPAMG